MARLLTVLCFFALLCFVHANWKAIRSNTQLMNICNKSVFSAPDTTDQQVFKLLYLDDSRVVIGSASNVYFLNSDMDLENTFNFPLSGTDLTNCESTFGEEGEFVCKNYFTYAHLVNSTTLRVCGTYTIFEPRCWLCAVDGSHCSDDFVAAFMPRFPTQNFTAIFIDGSPPYYYLGALYDSTSSLRIFAKVPVNFEGDVYNGAGGVVDTDRNEEQFFGDNTNFVGSIEWYDYIYFFYREEAIEYSNIGNIVYSRVARVCKNDAGGSGSPLSGEFTTFLKTRLMCSVGSDYPFIFNEIQDVVQSPRNENFTYGLFTTQNAGLSSTAICRYDMNELNDLFNEDNRRGQPSATELWQKITKEAGDTKDKRSCQSTFDSSLYNHLLNYPFMNTNAPNCGLGTTCNDYARSTDEALAVFEGIRGQQLAVFNDTGNTIEVYIGTINNTVYEASITASEVIIKKQRTIKADITSLTQDQIENKWPLGVSYLEVNGNYIYGTVDNFAFKITREPGQDMEILDRTPSMNNVTFPQKINGSIVRISKLFEGPGGSGLSATFSGGLETYTCSQKSFRSKGIGQREFLAVLCEIKGTVKGFTGNIIVSSSAFSLTETFNVIVELDESDIFNGDPSEVHVYDKLMAEYRYKFNNWLKENVTCPNTTQQYCPSPSNPGN